MKTIKFFQALLLGVAVIAPRTTPGATVTWVGGSGDWNTTTNWSTGALPGMNDDVVSIAFMFVFEFARATNCGS